MKHIIWLVVINIVPLLLLPNKVMADETNPTDSEIRDLSSRKCVGCHTSGGNDAGGFSWSEDDIGTTWDHLINTNTTATRGRIVSGQKVLDPGNTATSALYGSVNGSVGYYSIDNMTSLTDREKSFFKNWVSNGFSIYANSTTIDLLKTQVSEGQVVTTVTAACGQGIYTYDFKDDPSSKFSISSEGMITVAPGKTLSEGANYKIIVRATDGSLRRATVDITVNISGVLATPEPEPRAYRRSKKKGLEGSLKKLCLIHEGSLSLWLLVGLGILILLPSTNIKRKKST